MKKIRLFGNLKFASCIFMIFLIFVFVIIIGFNTIYDIRTDVKPGSRDINNPTQISSNEEIQIKILKSRNDTFATMYTYWDNNKEDKGKIENNLFTFIPSSTVKAPSTPGLHILTVQINSLQSKDFYYIVK